MKITTKFLVIADGPEMEKGDITKEGYR